MLSRGRHGAPRWRSDWGDYMRFNGISPSEFNPKIFVSHEVISSIPPRELRLLSTAQQSYLAGVQLSPREVHLHLNFAGRSLDNANAMSRQIAGLFCKNVLSEYEPTHMPGKALSVILQSASDPDWHWGFGVIEYVFAAPRPFYHSTAETVITGTNNIRIEPRGSVSCRPVISHTMAATSAALTITVNGTTVMRIRNPIGANLQAGQIINVDFVNRIVTISGEAAMDYVDYTASDWHPEILGATEIVLSDAGATTVRWVDEWY